MAPALAGLVLALDLAWSLIVGSTGTIAYGLVDAPAHLATCVVLLLATVAISGSKPPLRFGTAALIASVAIDLDHIPGYIGSHLLTGGLPRPYSHSLIVVAALVATAAVVRRSEVRQICLGAAFGVGAHLFRDLATGPGVPLLWPISGAVATVPYALYAVGLFTAAAVTAALERLRHRPFRSFAAMAGAMLLAAALLAASASATPSRTISLGAYIPGATVDASRIDAYAREVGQSPVIVSSYAQWPRAVFQRSELAPTWARGAVTLLTWEPWTADERGYPLGAIARGRYDGYLRRSARAAKTWGRPIFVRFAHEMNGNWYPWGTVNGNTPKLYKKAWRHVVGLFRDVGARNVRWVWCPYVTNGGRFGFARFFPGNRWVDWIGLDGFNWGSKSVWKSFKGIFSTSYRVVKRLSDRPIMIPETGSTEIGGNKASWVSRALNRELPRFARIRALIWFCEPFRGIDTRVNSSPAALASLRRAMAGSLYHSSRRRLLATPSLLHF